MSHKPCPMSLSMAKLPAKKWETRDELLGLLDRARTWMQESPNKYSLAQLAALAMLSPYHFHRLFRATFGMTPNQFLKQCRLEKARRLLVVGELSVGQIGMEVGFESAASFSREFKKLFGYPPSAEPHRLGRNGEKG